MIGVLKRILRLTAKDWRLLTRNYYVAAILLVAVMYIAATRFMIPAELNTGAHVVLWDETGSQVVRQFYEAHAEDPAQLTIVNSADEFAAAVEGYNHIGLHAQGELGLEQFEVTYQGYENVRTRRLLEATLHTQAALLTGHGAELITFTITVLNPDVVVQKPPFNESMVPIWVYSEAGMVGLLLGATLLFAEKDERTLRAIRVTPASTAEYLAARSLAMFMMGMLFTVVVTVFTVGFDVNWLALTAVVFLGSTVMTLIMMAVANMFDSLGQFIFAGIVVMTLLGLPTVAYFMPSFSPPLLRLLPTHPMIFGLREAYFPTGTPGLMTQALTQLAITLAIAFPLAALTFRRQLIARDV